MKRRGRGKTRAKNTFSENHKPENEREKEESRRNSLSCLSKAEVSCDGQTDALDGLPATF